MRSKEATVRSWLRVNPSGFAVVQGGFERLVRPAVDLPFRLRQDFPQNSARPLVDRHVEMHLEQMIHSGEATPEPSEKMEFIVEDDSPEELCTWVEVESPQSTART